MLCHLILAAPVLGLGLFWFLPLSLALPSYLLVLLASALLYRKIMEDMRLPVMVGREEMIGAAAQVVKEAPDGIVKYRGELWSAVSREPISKGTRVRILGFEGMKVVVASMEK